MKKIVLWVIFIAVVLFVSTRISKEFHSKILHISNDIKIGIVNFNDNFVDSIKRYFNQAQQIKELTYLLQDKELLQYSFDSLKEDHEQLLKAIETSSLIDFSNFYLVRNISYVKINDYDQIWLKSSLDGKNKEGTVFGLIQDGYAAGIARFEDNHLIGYLNGDDNCSYSVMIGENKIPGVAKYDINRGFIVDYIPLFPAVEVGDVVYTSGYDKIFYTGIPVGGVQAVEYRQGYQIAVVKPVSQKISRFYWLVDVNPKENIEVNLD